MFLAALMAVAALAALLAGLGAIACGREEAIPAQGAVLRVALREWSVSARPTFLPAGEVTVTAENRGRITHELLVLRTDTPAGALPAPRGFVDEGAAGETVTAMYDLRRGRRETRSLSLSPGRYILLCNLVGHYQLGMAAALEVR